MRGIEPAQQWGQTTGGQGANRRGVTRNGSSITGNTADTDGGGIYNFSSRGTVTLDSTSSITSNSPDNCGPAGSVTGCFEAPGAPQSLTATPGTVPGSGNVDLAWSAPLSDGGTPVTSYAYPVSTDGGATFGKPVNVDNVTTATDDCGTGITCTYEVFAINQAGQGPASATATATGP